MSEHIKTSKEECLYLADQERHARTLLKVDDVGEIRASIIREWALRSAVARFGVTPQ